jgi:cytoskeletal protein RodZ
MNRFSRAFLYVIYFVGVVGLSTAIAASFRSQATAPSVSTGKSSQHVPSVATKSPTKASAPSQSNSNQSSDTNSSASQLSNTGPGNTAVVFVITCLGAAAAYRRFMIRKLHN